LEVTASPAGARVKVPAVMPDKDATVVALEIDAPPQVIAPATKPATEQSRR
jgi:hypothetical protein